MTGREPVGPVAVTSPLADLEPLPTLRFASVHPGVTFANRYELEAVIGSGGSGEVYRAFDRIAEAAVAVKVLYPDGGDPVTALERARREVRSVRSLNHPGIVRVHDMGLHEGLLYTIMELLAGETLRERLRRTRLAPGEVRVLFAAILDALGAAHAKGILHRDVKPANVFLCADRVVLLDFGLARRENDPALTASGAFLGTPHYVSPEQARGDRDLSPASDVYSAGVMLWELLAGEPPFTGASLIDIVNAHLSRPIPAPRRALRGAPPDLRRLAVWMLRKEPGARPRDARIARARLARRAGSPIVARLAARARSGRVLHATTALALSATVAWLLPCKVESQAGELRAVNAIGAAVHRWSIDATHGVVPITRGPFARRYLALQAGVRTPDSPFNVYEVDLLTGARSPFTWRLPETGTRWPAPSRYYNSDFRGSFLVRWEAERGPMFVLAYEHSPDWPAQVLGVLPDRTLVFVAAHPGHLVEPQFVPAGNGADEPELIVCGAVNNRLGKRAVVFALDPSRSVEQRFDLPPYQAGSTEVGEARYYTFLSAPWGFALGREGPNVTLVYTDRVLRVDARTGYPRDLEQNGGLAQDQWIERRADLLTLLKSAARGSDRAEGAAATALALERFAEGLPAPALSGVAHAHAAECWRRVGRFREAWTDALKAMRDEPSIAGHARLAIDIATRLRDPGRVRQVLDALRGRAQSEFDYDALIAFLLLDRPEDQARHARALRPDPEVPGGYYGLRAEALIALHSRDDRALRATIQASGNGTEGGDFAFLRALAAVLLDPPDLVTARAWLAEAERGRGNGNALPFRPLAAYLDALDRRGAQVARAELKAAVEDQRSAARDDLQDLYWLSWGEALRDAALAATKSGRGMAPVENRLRTGARRRALDRGPG